MKKPLFRYPLAALLLVLLFASCKSKAPKQAKYIPKTASIVLVLDAQAMQNKLQQGGLNIDTLVNRFFQRDSSDAGHKQKFEELRTQAGIDWNSQLYFYMLQKGGTQPNGTTHVFNVLCSLSDPAKFEAYLLKQEMLKNKTIQKENGYSSLLVDDGALLSWNSQYLIATIYNRNTRPVYDTASMSFKKPEVSTDIEKELKQEVSSYYNLKEEESLAGVTLFTDMFREKADGYAFTSTNSYLSALSMMPMQIPKLEELLKDNYSASLLSFEAGKILVKSTSYPNQLVSHVLQEYPSPSVNLSLIEHYPSQHINGILLAAFNPEIAGGLLKQLEVEGLVNGFLGRAGLSSQDVYQSFKGDIAVVVSDLGMAQPEPQQKKDESDMVHKKPVYKMIINLPVGNKNNFFKLMDKAAEQGLVVKNGPAYKGGALLSMFGLYLQADDKNLLLASDSLTYAQYIASSAKAAINTEAMDRFKGKTGVFYFDIANTIGSFLQEGPGGYHNSMKTAKETFKDVIATGDPFNGKSSKSILEVRMQNEKQNSLVTLTSLITDVAVDMRQQARKEREMELFPGGVPAIIRTN